jgi:YidC/Oxa1 family membrane protein insertase
MDKRTLLAIAIAFLIIIASQIIFSKYYKPEPKKSQKQAQVQEEEKAPVPVESPQPGLTDTIKPETIPSEEKEIRVETKFYSAVFTTKGATLKHYALKEYKDKEGNDVVLLSEPGAVPALSIGSQDTFNLSHVNFNVSPSSGEQGIILDKNNSSDSLIFVYGDSDALVKRTFTFYNNEYKIDIKDETSGLRDYWITLGTNFGIFDKKSSYTHVGPVLLEHSNKEDFNQYEMDEPESYTEGVKWIAQEDKYFFAALVPTSSIDEARVWQVEDSTIIAMRAKPGVDSFILYAGPKDQAILQKLGFGLEYIIDFGFFSIIARPIFWLLKFFYNIVGNFGWAIIIVTIILRIPFIPLFEKSQKSMKRMQEIQPKMAALREKYKNKKDPQKMNQEMMELYRKHKVNPVGGCLPLLLQLPIFFAFYKILLSAIELRGAPFILWIKDLSAPDALFGHIPSMIPLIGGFAVGPLPIVMGISMFVQQKMTPTTADPRQAKMFMFMPIVLTFIFLNFASGLVLYWFVSNLLSIAQQFYTNRKLAKEAG